MAADTEPGTPGRTRLEEFDVVRSMTLLGVFTMNYIVYWRIRTVSGGWRAPGVPGWVATLFDPWSGPLSTRFAATLSTLVGVGVALGARSAIRGGDPAAIASHRWVLRRRGVLFILIGVMFDVPWSGEILHFIGTYLILVAWMITWRTSRLALAAVGVVAVTVAQRVGVFLVVDRGSPFSWWNGVGTGMSRRAPVGTPQGYLSSVLSWGGHPVLPWLTFVIVGMILARVLVPENGSAFDAARMVQVLAGSGLLIAAGCAFAAVGNAFVPDRWRWVTSFDPVSLRGSPFGLAMPAYVLTTAGSSVAAVTVISSVAKRFAGALPVRVLARAGRMTFTLYVLHGVVPWFLTTREFVGRNHSMYRSLWIAFGAWAVGVVAAAVYQRRFRIGPLEWLLRKVGG